MKYREFGKTGFKVSALGFGAMRLPSAGGPMNVLEPESIELIRYAVDNGVNYIDSAYGYAGGKSEVVVGKALQDGYRQKVRIATKMPSPQIQKTEDFERIFNEQLARLQTDKIDFYLAHGLNKASWIKMRDLGYLPWLEKKIAEGRIGQPGFSFHDTFDVLKEIIDAYSGWKFCQVQYNYMDIKYQGGTRGVKYAAEKGLGVVVMEPLRGGRLAKEPPKEIADVWASAATQRSPVEWGLLWVWEHPEVSVVLSGMGALSQVTQNVEIAGRSGPGVLSAEEMALFDKVRKAYQKLMPIPCTACRYCMPCPSNVEIPRIFELYNDAVMYDDPVMGRMQYSGRMALKVDQRADKCTECKQCVEKCPQKINVPDSLKKAHELLLPKA
jgi:predicted aldo/keto reductase-like oxidoreductase